MGIKRRSPMKPGAMTMADNNAMVSSPLFAPDMIDNLNKSLAAIDDRLVVFAYYQPKQYGGSPEFNFYKALINLHSLFGECNMAFCAVLGVNSDYRNIFYAVKTMRNLLCHHFPEEDYKNKQELVNIQNYLFRPSSIGVQSFKEDIINALDEKNCSALLNHLRSKCEKFLLIAEKNIQMNANKPDFIGKIVDSMLDSLFKDKWGQSSDLIEDYAVNKNVKKPPRNLYNLLEGESDGFCEFEASDGSPYNRNDLANKYIEQFYSKAEIKALLDGASCPKPALPYDVYKLLATELKTELYIGKQSVKMS